MCNVPRYVRAAQLHKELKLDSIGNYIRKMSQNFYNNIHKTNNNLLLCLNNHPPQNPITGKRPKKTAELPDFAVVKRRRRHSNQPRFASASFNSTATSRINPTMGVPHSILSYATPSISTASSSTPNTACSGASSFPPPIT